MLLSLKACRLLCKNASHIYMFNHIWIVSARQDEDKSCWHATRSISWPCEVCSSRPVSSPPCRLWWGQSSPAQAPPAQLTALWLIPCPHLVPLRQPQKCPHVSLIPLSTQEAVSLPSHWWFMTVGLMQHSTRKVSHLLPLQMILGQVVLTSWSYIKDGNDLLFWYL